MNLITKLPEEKDNLLSKVIIKEEDDNNYHHYHGQLNAFWSNRIVIKP